MPVWHIHHHPSTFTAAQKESLASAIADWYHHRRGLPRFYVVVLFHPSDTIFRGGKLAGENFVRFEMVHIARESAVDDRPKAEAVQEQWAQDIFQRHIVDRGLEWEYSYANTPRLFWRVDGLVPPEADTEGEKLWLREDRAVPYQ